MGVVVPHHRPDCPGPHQRTLGPDIIGLHCDRTGGTLWYARCRGWTLAGRCTNDALPEQRTCAAHTRA